MHFFPSDKRVTSSYTYRLTYLWRSDFFPFSSHLLNRQLLGHVGKISTNLNESSGNSTCIFIEFCVNTLSIDFESQYRLNRHFRTPDSVRILKITS